MQILPAGAIDTPGFIVNRGGTYSDGGFVLLKSLISMGAVLLCASMVCVSIAVSVKQSGVLQDRLKKELAYRNEQVLNRLK